MSDSPSQEAYRVLARKYRPQTFDQLIGQDAMVRTLRNAIEAKRLAHAFIMTGVRGVGKTTTARLIARALNCVGPDGTGAETIEPCGVCEFCLAIAAGTHPDVIEMDAASNTGVDDIRTIIDNVPYAASSARYKIYIIDEVHMLSRNAFNALLKTLEEPPSHVKFIFATTEIAKVPVTVLSRCQRFDLKRVDAALLAQHFAHICEHENVEAEPAALALIAQAAEGSVRDGLSLLDQAIAHSGAHITADQVREMIGLADNAAVLELARTVLAGDVPAAIDLFEAQYKNGADPQSVIEALLEAVHWLTKCRLYPNQAPAAHTAPEQHAKGLELASSVAIPALNTAWQILLKGLAEVKAAPRPVAAAEMVLVRLGYAATLPSPADLVKKLEHKPTSAAPAAPPQAHQKAPANEPAAVAAPVTAFKSAASIAPSPAPSAVAPPADGPVAVVESHLRLVETPQSETIEQSVDE
ncbi:MAG: DNA polymerase III subunit gamma/tau, partial [Pseudomonadota bacterium]